MAYILYCIDNCLNVRRGLFWLHNMGYTVIVPTKLEHVLFSLRQAVDSQYTEEVIITLVINE